ncbi:hypothetical protein FRC11_009242 [Ceratobasidium sp. 423]|nr:hypothetical protein FRC11_009242 [Ceratobasidium sp. 423]
MSRVELILRRATSYYNNYHHITPCSMNSRVDQRWGRPLEQYAPSYDIIAARERARVIPEMEEEAQMVKDRIYGEALSIRGHVPNPGNLVGFRGVTLPMLEAVLKLTLSPRHLDFFADPMFIGGCIRLLTQVKPEGKPSPFSYEFGYLCFKIIAIGIGAWVLKVTNNLDMVIHNIETDLGIEPLLMFSGHVSRVLMDNIFGGHGACDWVMGWETFEERPDPQPFLSPSDLLSMLNVLWEDRKLYLQVLLRTYFPGLSGVAFVLWRYACSPSVTAVNSRNKLMVVPFCELLWRSMLVATEDQFFTLHYINNFVYYDKVAGSWDESPKYVDLDDSCTVLDAFSARMVPTNSRLFKPLPLLQLIGLLRFVIRLAQPGSEGCYPPLFGGTIERIWVAVENGDKSEDIIDTTGTIMICLSELIEPLNHTNYSSRTALKDLVAALEQHDFLELLSRLLFLLEPGNTPAASRPDMPRNTWFLANTLYFVKTLAKVAPDMLLGYQFKERLGDWYKMEYALLTTTLIEASCPSSHKALRRQCLELWRKVGESFGLAFWMRVLVGPACSYSRCPQRKNVLPVDFMCPRCLEEKLRYCSAMCQTRWVLRVVIRIAD